MVLSSDQVMQPGVMEEGKAWRSTLWIIHSHNNATVQKNRILFSLNIERKYAADPDQKV